MQYVLDMLFNNGELPLLSCIFISYVNIIQMQLTLHDGKPRTSNISKGSIDFHVGKHQGIELVMELTGNTIKLHHGISALTGGKRSIGSCRFVIAIAAHF